MTTNINQSAAQAHGDLVGRDKISYNFTSAPTLNSSIVDALVAKLKLEMQEDQKIRETVESLQYFNVRRSVDGIDGLEAKLMKADRKYEIPSAFEKKELFVKLLEKWSLYASAQEIFAVLLARIDHEFNYCIHPYVQDLAAREINRIVTDRIVEPTILMCGTGAFTLNHNLVMGMVYWLAEQCFIRWHK